MLKHNLQYLRIKKGITQRTLSELTGIPQSTISKIEKGHRKAREHEIMVFASAMNVPAAKLLEEDNSLVETGTCKGLHLHRP